MKQPAIFLDRDGVINENRPDYVRSWADVSIYPSALAALAQAADLPYKIVIVTNQSAVGRGLVPLAAVEAINRRLVAAIEKAGGRIDGVYFCPHAPDDRCDCRKPQPGLLLRAAREHNIDLVQSVMIGDALSDLAAGRAAGVGRTVLLLTGRGKAQRQLTAADRLQPFPVYETLADALLALFP